MLSTAYLTKMRMRPAVRGLYAAFVQQRFRAQLLAKKAERDAFTASLEQARRDLNSETIWGAWGRSIANPAPPWVRQTRVRVGWPSAHWIRT